MKEFLLLNYNIKSKIFITKFKWIFQFVVSSNYLKKHKLATQIKWIVVNFEKYEIPIEKIKMLRKIDNKFQI